MDATFRFDGARASRTQSTVDVKTAEIPDLYNKDFWRELNPAFFENVADADIVISSPDRSGASDAEKFPRRAVDTSLPEIESIEPPVRVRVERFTCKASVKRKDGGNLLSHETDIPLDCPVVTTNAQTKKYTWTTGMSVDTGDPIPVGLAEQLLANAPDSGSVSVMFDIREGTPPKTGETFRGYPCQSTLTSLAMNTCTASFASAPALDMKSLAELQNGFRRRASASYSRKTRETGEANTGGEIPAGGAAITKAAQAGAGQMRAERFKGADDEEKKINLDPDDITTENKIAKMRKVIYAAVNAEGEPVNRSASFLVTIPKGGAGGSDDDDIDDENPEYCEDGRPYPTEDNGRGNPSEDDGRADPAKIDTCW